MSDLADIARYAIVAVVGLLIFYVMLRVGTLAVLRSIAEFRAAELSRVKKVPVE